MTLDPASKHDRLHAPRLTGPDAKQAFTEVLTGVGNAVGTSARDGNGELFVREQNKCRDEATPSAGVGQQVWITSNVDDTKPAGDVTKFARDAGRPPATKPPPWQDWETRLGRL